MEDLKNRFEPAKRLYSCEDALAYIAECQYATLEGLAMKKSTPKSELWRQDCITRTCLAAVHDYGKGAERLDNWDFDHRFPRVYRALVALKKDGGILTGATSLLDLK